MGQSVTAALSGSVAKVTDASVVFALSQSGGGGAHSGAGATSGLASVLGIYSSGTTSVASTSSKYRNGQQYLFQDLPGNYAAGSPKLDPTVYTATEFKSDGVTPIPASYEYCYEARPVAITGLQNGPQNQLPSTPTKFFISNYAGWSWDRPNGDILDKNLVHNGDLLVPPVTPVAWHTWALNFATVPHTYALDITAATQYCQNNNRWMAFIWKMSASTRTLASKISTTPATISVTYADATTQTLNVRVHAQIGGSTTFPQSMQFVEYQVGTTTNNVAIEFERPTAKAVHGAVTAATLNLTVTKTGSSANLLCFIADPLLNTNTVQLGVANDPAVGYYDSGITSLPSVIGAHRYMDGTTLTDFEFTGDFPGTSTQNVGDEANYDPGLFTLPFNAANANPITYANKLPHFQLGKWVGGQWPHVQYQDSTRSIVSSSYTGEGFVPLAPGVGALRISMDLNPQYNAEGVFVGSSASASSTTTIRIFLPSQYWGTDHIFVRYYLRIGTPLGSPYRLPFARERQQATQQASNFAIRNFPWTRSGGVITVSSPLQHAFSVGNVITVTASSDDNTVDPITHLTTYFGAVPTTAQGYVYTVQSVIDNYTFTMPCQNTGLTSGTVAFYPCQWTRVGAVATVKAALHPYNNGDGIKGVTSTDPAAFPNASGSYALGTITKVDDNTFTIPCNNAGSTSGGVSFSPDPNVGDIPGPGVLVGGVRGPGKIGRYDWAGSGGKTGIAPDHFSASGGTSGSAGGGRGWQLRNRWSDLPLTAGPDVGGWAWGLHTYDMTQNPRGYYNAANDDQTSSQTGYGQIGGLGGVLYAEQWYCYEWEYILNTVYPDTSFIANWTRSGTTLTVTGPYNVIEQGIPARATHNLGVRPTTTICITAVSGANDVSDLPGGAQTGTLGGPYPVTIVDANTFTLQIPNAGAASGTAVFSDFESNGTVRVWCDGRLVLQRSDLVLRVLPYWYPYTSQSTNKALGFGGTPGWPSVQHAAYYNLQAPQPGQLRPTGNLGLRSLWFNWFHGGIDPNCVDRVMFITGLVYGTSYHGPMKLPPTGLAPTPAWLSSGTTAGQWTQVPNSRFDQMTDMQTVVNARLAAAGTFAAVTDQYPTETFHYSLGEPRGGQFGDSGGCLRTSGSEMIVSGGGGAGSGADNGVRGLRLEDDAPAWRVLVRPTGGTNYNGEFIPIKASPGQRTGDPPTPYNKDKDGTITTAATDGSPIARHTYRHQIVDDATDDFYYTRCDSVWPTDSRPPYPGSEEVNSIHLPSQFGTGWNSVNMASTWPNTRPPDRIHPKPGGNSSPSNYCWTCKFPNVGDARDGFVYQATGNQIFLYEPNYIDPSTSQHGRWTLVTTFGADKGPAAIDPTRGIILFGTTNGLRDTIANGGVLPVFKVAVLNGTGDFANVYPVAFDMGSGFTLPTLEEEIGFNEARDTQNINPSQQQLTVWQLEDMAELEYDRWLDKFLWFQDDQRMLTLTFNGISAGTWHFRFDVLATTGTPPPRYGSSPAGAARQLMAFWGRMRYIHRLRGVCLIPDFDLPAYFLRTS